MQQFILTNGLIDMLLNQLCSFSTETLKCVFYLFFLIPLTSCCENFMCVIKLKELNSEHLSHSVDSSMNIYHICCIKCLFIFLSSTLLIF